MTEDPNIAPYLSKYRRKYGLDWPKEAHDTFIDLVCAKKWRENPYKNGQLLDPWEHMLRAARALFTKDQFTISKWTEEHAHDWCTETFCITWGCAASSKSNDYGCLAVLDWITDPTDTITIMASTTADMLQYRSFESAIRYFKILKRNPRFFIPGREHKQRLAIINVGDDEDETASTVKASIKGVAVQKGTVDEARSNLQGAHLPYVRLVLDELSQMREAAMEARTNLSMGTKDFRLFGLCNPDSFNDLAARHSVPKGGWGMVTVEDGFWRTQWGCVRHHDGTKSPAVLEENGPEKYPHLINQKAIDEAIVSRNGNTDDPQIWTMVRGWPSPTGSHATVLTDQAIQVFKVKEPVVWRGNYVMIAGFDPAFTSGGDNAVLKLAALGYSGEGTLTLAFLNTFTLKIEASSKRPVTYQLCDQVREIQAEYGFDFRFLGVDDSGTQSVADVIAVETGIPPFRVNFAWKPTEIAVSVTNTKPAKEAYKNRITEYWFSLAEMACRGQIRGLDDKAAEEFCQRRVLTGKNPRILESKEDLKKRTKRSPDYADAAAICAGVAREMFGVIPGGQSYGLGAFSQGHDSTYQDEDAAMLSLARLHDIDSNKDNYLTPAL